MQQCFPDAYELRFENQVDFYRYFQWHSGITLQNIIEVISKINRLFYKTKEEKHTIVAW